ncbi:hypothetical protein DL764_009338 [Monosporascus ibericus]|uniref:Rhamnogalacturonase A/B/Epimerase-like pectate lyase domain-containing protein n=1 Tax=Monosporascus ibericus TaxID=155417 RepID=A0A4Q4SV68_9PEZI|nr:hypothetical protein DL764_009338 [Monosporascus ibericus]
MRLSLLFGCALLGAALDLPSLPDWYDASLLPPGWPGDAPEYMVDNTRNTFGVAPDKGTLDKPVTEPEEQFRLMENNPHQNPNQSDVPGVIKRQGGGFWYENIKHGDMPFAPDGYAMFRDVREFGAVGDGVTDDTAAINRAASWLSKENSDERCGRECGQTTRLGAVVYFPTGIYLISSPIIQYYFTQFVGDANARPTIRGSANFTGIALIDCDPYIPGGNGANWYINQNQFFRQIRNFIFDMKDMPWWGQDGDQFYAPTGIHWQVSQAASLQHLDFQMPLSDSRGSTNATGIFMENGSGGFLSDLYFFGGGIGFRAGSQQYTARNLKFELTLTAISMIWDWGFTWQNIEVIACYVAIEAKSLGGLHNQGAASITLLDSYFRSVPYPIVLRNGGPHPNIILENVRVELSASVVLIDGGETILPGSQGLLYFNSWGMGKRYTSMDGDGEIATGFIDPPPQRPPALLDGSRNIFARPKPTYGNLGAGSFVVATDHGISNMADGDQADAINRLLADNVGTPIYFPSGVYMVKKTVEIPVGSIIVGELWPQIMGTGDFFADENEPQVMIRVGNPGDSGIIEISDMMFSVKGPTRGAIMMEWNVHESTQGSAAMWDSHFRVGGGYGSDLTIEECPKSTGEPNRDCMAAFLLLHVTRPSSGYFENVWVWTADHDMDVEVPGGTETTTDAQINIYTARGPCWFYGTGSEHHQIYQYQLNNAKNIFMTHIQTETPYYQPTPDASEPYELGKFPGDPDFAECEAESTCMMAWGLRVINSRDILIYTAGMYSFFYSYGQICLEDENCQDNMVETSYTQGFWFYNIFTKGVAQMITPRGGIPALLAGDNQAGFTTEVSAWLALALGGGNLGGTGGSPRDGSGAAYIDSIIFVSPSPTIQCWAPCTLVMPPSTLAQPTVLSFDPVETSLVVGGSTVTEIQVPTVTVTVISFSAVVVPAGETSSTFALETSLNVPPVEVTGGGGTVSTITLPAFATASRTSTISVTVLPTTVTEIDGVEWTFSMDQFTDLATYSGTTLLTTTLRDEPKPTQTSTSTSSDTIIPIWVQVGGFYWSPVYPPGPTPPPLPRLPRLPEFPPILNPPCFKLFGIFSINCPPDKSRPTTHFTTGPVKPTCTAGCGKLDGDSRNEDETTSSTCRTATSTDCYTRTNEVICNTYIGCECQTKTATNAWVSCNDQTCTTTRTEEITGCFITASHTTVGEYCPTPQPTDPYNYDDGSNDDGGDLGRIVTTTFPPRITVDGTGYQMPASGTVVIGGSTLTAPTGTSKVTTTVGGGTVVTLVPTSTGQTVSITRPGVTTVAPPTQTATPPWEEPGGGDPGQDGSQAVWIFFRYQSALVPESPIPAVGTEWVWYEWPHIGGGTLQLCSARPVYNDRIFDRGLNNPGWPWSMTPDVDIYGHSGCRYVGNGNGPGQFECDDVNLLDCILDPQYSEQLDCTENEPWLFVAFRPRVRCVLPVSSARLAGLSADADDTKVVNGTTNQQIQVDWPGYRAWEDPVADGDK